MSNNEVMTHPEPKPIPVPPEFPFTWETPDDAHMFWAQDRLHFPEPVRPMDGAFTRLGFLEGLNPAAEALELPVRTNARLINTYIYVSMFPSVPPEEMEAQGERAQMRTGEAMTHLRARWDTEWLPEIKEHLAFWDEFDLQGATLPDLLTHLDDTFERAARLWEIHFLVVLPGYIALSEFDKLYRDLFGAEGAFDAFALLQGFDNMTLETNRAMWNLSRRALTSTTVQQILEEQAADEVLTTLEKTSDGQAFLGELQAYLKTYGQRSGKYFVSSPNWIEDPTPVIKTLKDYITQPDRDSMAELAELAAQREQAVEASRERLKGYPQPVVEQFEFLLKAAQEGNVLSEDHTFWIDFTGFYKIRRVLMECGRRIAAAGVIENPDDVFYLTPDELREVAAALPEGDRRSLIAGRKAEMEHFSTINPPPVLGMDYGPPPDDPFNRFAGKFWGAPPQPSDEPNVLRGNAGSPGMTRGPARVVRSLDEADKLHKGDILVAETTAPPWTLLFATAGAVVTDTGGVLSHCAIVAREYRIPAVVGTGMATARIQDGQMLEVDGDGGIVRILKSA